MKSPIEVTGISVAKAALLSEEDWDIQYDTVQGFWNCFENKHINIVITISDESTLITNEYVPFNTKS